MTLISGLGKGNAESASLLPCSLWKAVASAFFKLTCAPLCGDSVTYRQRRHRCSNVPRRKVNTLASQFAPNTATLDPSSVWQMSKGRCDLAPFMVKVA